MRMSTLVTIGDFARMTYLSIKSLRYYHEVGLLAPASVDPDTGYRLYLLRRCPRHRSSAGSRDLDMPLGDVRAVLTAGDALSARNAIIAEPPARVWDASWQQTQAAVSSLRVSCSKVARHRSQVESTSRARPPTPHRPSRAEVAASDLGDWLGRRVRRTARRVSLGGDVRRAGPDGALYQQRVLHPRRSARPVAFIPITGSLARAGRVRQLELPATEFAVTLHQGPIRRTGQDLRRARHLRQRAGDRRGRPPDPGELPRHRR